MEKRADGSIVTEPRPAVVGQVLLRASARIFRLQQETLEGLPEPLTFRQFRILARVQEGHSTLSSLAELASRTLPTMSKSVDAMVRRELLTRGADPKDRRSMALEVTPAGLEALKAAHQALDALAKDLTEDVAGDYEESRLFIESVYARARSRLRFE